MLLAFCQVRERRNNLIWVDLEILGDLKSVDDERSQYILIMILHPISNLRPMIQEQDLAQPALSSVRSSSLPDTSKPERVQSQRSIQRISKIYRYIFKLGEISPLFKQSYRKKVVFR